MHSLRIALCALAAAAGPWPSAASARSTKKSDDQAVQCKDGSISKTKGRGACSHHGGVADAAQARAPAPAVPAEAAAAVPEAPAGPAEATPPPGKSSTSAREPAGRQPTSTRPQRPAPAGSPTAKCRDGSVSYSAQHSGACSHHGGVAEWLR